MVVHLNDFQSAFTLSRTGRRQYIQSPAVVFVGRIRRGLVDLSGLKLHWRHRAENITKPAPFRKLNLYWTYIYIFDHFIVTLSILYVRFLACICFVRTELHVCLLVCALGGNSLGAGCKFSCLASQAPPRCRIHCHNWRYWYQTHPCTHTRTALNHMDLHPHFFRNHTKNES